MDKKNPFRTHTGAAENDSILRDKWSPAMSEHNQRCESLAARYDIGTANEYQLD